MVSSVRIHKWYKYILHRSTALKKAKVRTSIDITTVGKATNLHDRDAIKNVRNVAALAD
jgi:hypothetical protein